MKTPARMAQPGTRRLSTRLAWWLDRLIWPEWATVMGTALIVGLSAGIVVLGFEWLIDTAEYVFFEVIGGALGFLGDGAILVIIPALGGLVGGPIIYFMAREAKGHGVPEVMEAVALHGGRIRPRVALVKSLASAVCIGSGGSVGSEGPIVQIGSALGSTVGQWLHLSEERIISLVACGAAGGIGAIFNAPIAGSLFALEVILGDFRATYFGSVVISAVIADVVVHVVKGSEHAFHVPVYALVNPGELGLYAVLGVLAAVVSVGFIRLLNWSEDVFEGWKGLPEYVKPATGGLLIGLLGLGTVLLSGQIGGASGLATSFGDPPRLLPAFFGVGYDAIGEALLGQMALGVALALLLLKLVATSLTLGSGGSGGTFAPALFLGAALGVAFGQLVNLLFPGSTAPAGAYALVGMAAVLAGTVHAPATAILLLFEITRDYSIILPLMFATVIAVFISRALQPESSYTIKLARRGIHLQHGRDIDLMEGITVEEAMQQEYDSVPPDLPLAELVEAFDRTHHHGFPVVEGNGSLVGIVTVSDLARAIEEGPIEGRVVRDIATIDGTAFAYPDESLATAMLRLGSRDVGRLPVVTRETPSRLVGIVRRENVIRAYNQAIARRTNISHRLKALQRRSQEPIDVLEIKVTEHMPCAGRTLREVAMQLPEHCIVASLQRRERILIPHGNTVIQSGDQLTLLTTREHAEGVKLVFREG